MAKVIRRLGRGLNSLVSDLTGGDIQSRPQSTSTNQTDGNRSALQGSEGIKAIMLTINKLTRNNFQPRSIINDEQIQSLAASMRQSGMLQPITVRQGVDGTYEIIAGERRWAAAKSIGMERIPAIVREATDEQMLELALIENIQREDLNAIDRAQAYRQFCTRFQLKPEEVAQRLGEDRTTVVNYLRLLELPEDIQGMVADGSLSMGHARCLLGVTDVALRRKLAEAAMWKELSVRALEAIVRREKERDAESPAATPEAPRLQSVHLRDLEQRFEQAVKTKVTIHEGQRKGSGRIIIEYYSLDDFDRIASALGVRLE